MPNQAILRELLDYNPKTGLFVRRNVKGVPSHRRNKQAGGLTKLGYVRIGIRGFGQLAAHRLAWVYMFGSIPNEDLEIDHIDGNPSNNAISNLRLATSAQQKQNKRIQSNNRALLKGAYYHGCHKGKKWRSQIKLSDDRLIFLGYFHTPEEAHQAYSAAAIRYFGEFARTA